MRCRELSSEVFVCLNETAGDPLSSPEIPDLKIRRKNKLSLLIRRQNGVKETASFAVFLPRMETGYQEL